VEGLPPAGHLQRVLLEDLAHLDPVAAQAEVLQAAQQLLARHPEVQTLLLECTNLAPYAAALAAATGRRVHHLLSLVHERWSLMT
jgi:hypothetical protein